MDGLSDLSISRVARRVGGSVAGILGQPLGVVGILGARQAAIDGLADQIRQGKVAVASGAGIGEVSLDQGAEAEAFVQLPREQQPGIGGHRRAPELASELGIEREADRARFRVTHWGVPCAPARSPREPHLARQLSNDTLLRSPFIS